MELTPAQMIARARLFAGQTDSSNSNVTDAQCLDFANEWLSDMVAFIDQDPITEATATTVENQATYNLPERAFVVSEVFMTDQNDKEYPLRVYQSQDMLALAVSQTWRTDDAGQPLYAYKAGTGVLGIFPKPSSSYASKTLRIFYRRVPTAMTLSDTSGPNIPDLYHETAPYWIAARIGMVVKGVDLIKSMMLGYEERKRQLKSVAQRFTDDVGWSWAIPADGPEIRLTTET